ncbi:MAG: ADP-ribosylglycohydrolase family protein [bacterium]
MDRFTLRSKFLGSMVGTGVGDGLGSSWEGWQRIESIKVTVNRSRLTYTDDTHMMIGVAESLIKKRGFDAEDMTLTFIKNYEKEPFRGYGPGPPRIFRWIKSGIPPEEATRRLYSDGSYGNGSAMRIAPVGLFYHDNLEKLKEVAHKSSQITHSHPLGKEGGFLQALAIALAINALASGSFKAGVFLERLHHAVESEVYRAKLKRIEGLLRGKADKFRVVKGLGNSIEAFNSVPTAIFSFLSHPDSFEQAVIFAVELGGDTDTIGAMTGAISGAYHGIEAIPAKWRDALENRGYIENLAHKLWSIKEENEN